MNHSCNGARFSADGRTLYRCSWDGTVTESVLNGQPCPNCSRPVDADDHGSLPVSTETIRFALLPGGRRAVISHSVVPASPTEPQPPFPQAAPSKGLRQRKSEWPDRLKHLALLLLVLGIGYYIGTNFWVFTEKAANFSHIEVGPTSSGAPLHPLLTEAEVEGLIELSPAAVHQCVREKVMNEIAKSPAPSQPRDRGPSDLTNLTVPQITVIRRLCQEQASS